MSFIYPWQCLAKRLVASTKSMKQIIQMKHKKVKNPYWLEANQLAVHKWLRTQTQNLRVVSPALQALSHAVSGSMLLAFSL